MVSLFYVRKVVRVSLVSFIIILLQPPLSPQASQLSSFTISVQRIHISHHTDRNSHGLHSKNSLISSSSLSSALNLHSLLQQNPKPNPLHSFFTV